MRHATDPDHVVAVTTIVSRERTHAARRRDRRSLGTRAHASPSWPSARPLFSSSSTIPPRLGLGMELCVGLHADSAGRDESHRRAAPRNRLDHHAAASVPARIPILFSAAGWFTRMTKMANRFCRIRFSILGWTPQWWKRLGLFHILRPLVDRNRARPRWIGCGGSPGSDDHQPTHHGPSAIC